jgi:hypothetical protein
MSLDQLRPCAEMTRDAPLVEVARATRKSDKRPPREVAGKDRQDRQQRPCDSWHLARAGRGVVLCVLMSMDCATRSPFASMEGSTSKVSEPCSAPGLRSTFVRYFRSLRADIGPKQVAPRAIFESHMLGVRRRFIEVRIDPPSRICAVSNAATAKLDPLREDQIVDRRALMVAALPPCASIPPPARIGSAVLTGDETSRMSV